MRAGSYFLAWSGVLLAICGCKQAAKSGVQASTNAGNDDLAAVVQSLDNEAAKLEQKMLEIELGIHLDGESYRLGQLDDKDAQVLAAVDAGAGLPSVTNIGGSAGATSFALTAPPRQLAPAELVSRIEGFEETIVRAKKRLAGARNAIAEARTRLSEYGRAPTKDPAVERVLEASVRSQEENAAASNDIVASVEQLYNRALAIIADQNLRIANIEGDVSRLNATVKALDDKLVTVPIRRPEDERADVRQHLANTAPPTTGQPAAGTATSTQSTDAHGTQPAGAPEDQTDSEHGQQGMADSAFFKHPRVEASNLIIDSYSVTGSVGLRATFGGASVAAHYELRYGVETLVAADATIKADAAGDVSDAGSGEKAPGGAIRPLFNAEGVTNRETSSMCIVFASVILTPSVSLGVNLGPLSLEGVKSRMDQTEAKRISSIQNHPKGMSFGAIAKRCQEFHDQVLRESPPSADWKLIDPKRTETSPTCLSDYDCLDALKDKDPTLQAKMVAECHSKGDEKRGICELRVVDAPGATASAACHPTSYSSNYVWPCARGLSCVGYQKVTGIIPLFSREIAGTCSVTPGQEISDDDLAGVGKLSLRNYQRALAYVGLNSAEIRQIGKLEPAAASPQALAAACDKLEGGRVAGWRLPNVRELWAVGIYDRELARAAAYEANKANANAWYYADGAFKGLIWSSDAFVYLKKRQGTLPIEDIRDTQKLESLAEGAGGTLYCVKGTPGGADDLGD